MKECALVQFDKLCTKNKSIIPILSQLLEDLGAVLFRTLSVGKISKSDDFDCSQFSS